MSTLRAYRVEAGISQVELASRAGVSRQLVGAVEAGRHLPRVDAAMALAAALGTDVDTLFSPALSTCDVVSGDAPLDGVLVRAGRVGERIVTAPARIGPDGWDVADGVIDSGAVSWFGTRRQGFVVAGCEPGLEVVERLLREKGIGAVAALASSRAAIDALDAGRVHAAVVHGSAIDEGESADTADRYRLTSWRVGLAAPADAPSGWWHDALSGRVSVVQRELGAGVQRTFEEAVGGGGSVPGPRVGGHLEAASRAVLTGMAAITIEPAALAVGAAFHPLEVHNAELWVAGEWANDSVIAEALAVVAGRGFQERLASIGGYDLTSSGARVA